MKNKNKKFPYRKAVRLFVFYVTGRLMRFSEFKSYSECQKKAFKNSLFKSFKKARKKRKLGARGNIVQQSLDFAGIKIKYSGTGIHCSIGTLNYVEAYSSKYGWETISYSKETYGTVVRTEEYLRWFRNNGY